MLKSLSMGLIACAALQCMAAVTVLNSPVPLHAPISTEFPPLRVQVTDAGGQPQASVAVKFQLPRTLSITAPNECIGEPGFTCTRLTDAQGIATLDHYLAAHPGNTFISISSLQWPAPDFGSARVEVIADPEAGAATLTVVSGDNQKTLIGSRYLEPFVVQAKTAAGVPMPNVDVTFVVQGGVAGGLFPNVFPIGDNTSYKARTDANGVAVSADFFGGWGLAGGHINAELVSGGVVSTAVFDFTNVNSNGGIDLALQNMWWGGPEQNGWGMSVVQHKERLFSVIYAYDDNGNPTWWVQPDGRWFAGVGSSFRGAMYSPRGTPFYQYDPGQFRSGSGFADLDLRFNGPEFGQILFGLGTADVNKRIQIQDFQSGAVAPFDVADMWWGGTDQNGWGVAILQQPQGLFAVWFTYNDAGEPTWFVMPTGSWSGGELIGGFKYSGGLYQTRGSPFANYDRSRFAITQSGTMTLTFTDDKHATLGYSIAGHSGVMPLVRQPF
jgi:hypothetical protein